MIIKQPSKELMKAWEEYVKATTKADVNSKHNFSNDSTFTPKGYKRNTTMKSRKVFELMDKEGFKPIDFSLFKTQLRLGLVDKDDYSDNQIRAMLGNKDMIG